MSESPNDFRNIVAFKDDDAVRKALGRAADALEQAQSGLETIAVLRIQAERNLNERAVQLEAALKQIADYRSPSDKARNELEICQDQSSVRGRLALNALESE